MNLLYVLKLVSKSRCYFTVKIFLFFIFLVSASLDMESFHKVIDNLGGATESRSSARMTPQGASREITKVTNFSLPTNGTVPSQQGVYTSFSRTSPSRLATCGSTVRRKTAKQVDGYG